MVTPDSPDEHAFSQAQPHLHPYEADGYEADGQATPEESPELLRWRADMLMDEMMLGAIDVGGAYAGSHQRPVDSAGNSASGNGISGGSATRERPHSESTAGESTISESPTGANQPASPSVRNGVGAPPSGVDASVHRAPAPQPAPDIDTVTQAQEESVSIPQGDSSAPAHASANASLDVSSAQRASIPTTDNPLLRPPAANQVAEEQAHTRPRLAQPDPVVNREYWQTHDVSSRVAGNGRSSTLLPRNSEVDTRTLTAEIATLKDDIGTILAPDHEWSIRSNHLLEKALNILKLDPSRSAEVEYYLKQARSIRTRAQQNFAWSQLYYGRLTTYLWAWSLLALVVLITCALYFWPLTEYLIERYGWSTNGFAAGNAVAFLSTLFAGALGASIGSLVNVRKRNHIRSGFFDRKYSLRGLILPPMSLIVASLIYLLFGLVFFLAGYTPLTSLVIVAFPISVALFYGYFQEKVYGTAE